MLVPKKTRIILLLISMLCISATIVFAQGPGFDEGVEDTPIDGGVSLVAAAAAAYGIKKIKDRKK